MKLSLIAILYLGTGICTGQTLRIAEVLDAVAEDAETMKLENGKAAEQLFVRKQAVITDRDVKSAIGLNGEISVQLTAAGAEKLKAATARMAPGRGRLAIIVEGKVVSAPVVQSELGGQFMISGFRDLSGNQLDDLARKMSGRPPRPADEPLEAKPGR